MKKATIITLLTAPALILTLLVNSSHSGTSSEYSALQAFEGGSQQLKSKYTYVGLDKCAGKCHSNNELGFQYDIIKNSPHGNAFKVLDSKKAMRFAREAKVAGKPQESQVCLQCHTTGNGLDHSSYAVSYRKEDGITCEACHKGSLNPQTVLPGEEDCLKCHDNSVHSVPVFDYKERLAKIAHPKPAVVIDTNRNIVKPGIRLSVKTGDSRKHFVGEHYGGGIVFYTLDDGMHGLIAAPADQGKGIKWYNGANRFTGSGSDGFQTGADNTERIVSHLFNDDQTGIFAAKVCNEYSVIVDGIEYNDWYLPSKSELNLLYLQKDVVGGFSRGYWSSTEVDSTRAWAQYFNSGLQFSYGGKDYGGFVRAIRAF